MGRGYRARDDDPVFYEIDADESWDDASSEFLTKELEALDSIESHGVEHWDAGVLMIEFTDPEAMQRAAAEYSRLPDTTVEARGNLLHVIREVKGDQSRNDAARVVIDLSKRTESYFDSIESWAWDLGFTSKKG